MCEHCGLQLQLGFGWGSPVLVDLDTHEQFLAECWKKGLHNPPQFAAVIRVRDAKSPLILPVALEIYGSVRATTLIEHYRVDHVNQVTNRSMA